MDAHGSRYVENFSCCMYDQISRNFRSLTENAESVTHTRTHTQTDPPTYTGLLNKPPNLRLGAKNLFETHRAHKLSAAMQTIEKNLHGITCCS